MKAKRHRWKWSEKMDGSAACKDCGMKTFLKEGAGKRGGTARVYRWKDGIEAALNETPRCE